MNQEKSQPPKPVKMYIGLGVIVVLVIVGVFILVGQSQSDEPSKTGSESSEQTGSKNQTPATDTEQPNNSDSTQSVTSDSSEDASPGNTTPTPSTNQDAPSPSSEVAVDTNTSTSESGDAAADTSPTTTPTPGNTVSGYVAWDQTVFDQNTHQRRWLYFHADWCPKCQALDADFSTNRSNIPNDLVIFKVDYDTATALKSKYGVTLQTTVLQINAAGDEQERFVGNSTRHTLREILEQFRA